ncbi:sugar ABC transporter ATP-binding protein [Candidatus Magnetomorum sp. HK-1]|nr:sugar ABC transporter ATP-binding protein [Candidatus Magnetomorum sp. HK-1]
MITDVIHSEKNVNNKKTALSVNNLSKCFKFYDNPWHRALEWMSFGKRLYHKPFWSLQDISFHVKPGEILGIIGQNGAGKSTLLKILSGIIQPTSGNYEIEGKLLAMLELGMDFNPNLSGKENIFRTAEIWGFPKDYTKDLLGKIIDFSELGDFIERPVKFYSSGMAVRLAFSLFAFLKCDVLIIDEVLAVGDLFFHQKCYKRIEKLVSEKTTIILVTHNMADVQQFCDNAVVLDKGQIFYKGNAREAAYMFTQIKHREKENIVPFQKVRKNVSQSGNLINSKHAPLFYSNATEAKSFTNIFWPPDEFFSTIQCSDENRYPARLTRFAICNDQKNSCNSFKQGDYAIFYYEFYLYQGIDVPISALTITNRYNVDVHGKTSSQHNIQVPDNVQKNACIRIYQRIQLKLTPGEYGFICALMTMHKDDYEQRYNLMQEDVEKRVTLLNVVDQVGCFIITPEKGFGLKGPHLGICDLPGDCQMSVT